MTGSPAPLLSTCSVSARASGTRMLCAESASSTAASNHTTPPRNTDPDSLGPVTTLRQDSVVPPLGARARGYPRRPSPDILQPPMHARSVAAAVLSLSLGAPPLLRAQGHLPRRFDADVARALKEFQVPGAAIAVVKD